MVRQVIAFALVVALAACQTGPRASVRSGPGPSMAAAQAQPYNGPKARIAVGAFVDKSAKGEWVIGSGLADMLATALFNTDRYVVLDRGDLDAVLTEQDLASSGRVSQQTATAIGQVEGADLLLFGTITEYDPDSFGAGGVILGAITLGASIALASKAGRDAPIGLATYTESSIAADIKIVDAATGRVVYAGSASGKHQNFGGGLLGGVGPMQARVPYALGGFAGSGPEAAARKLIDALVTDVVKNTPEQYLRVAADQGNAPPVGAYEPIHPVKLPASARPYGVTVPETIIIANEATYHKTLTRLGLTPDLAPVYDFRLVRLVAVFGGRTDHAGVAVGVVKAIHHEDRLEVVVRQVDGPLPIADQERVNAGGVASAGYPFDLVWVANPGKPLVVIWDGAKTSAPLSN